MAFCTAGNYGALGGTPAIAHVLWDQVLQKSGNLGNGTLAQRNTRSARLLVKTGGGRGQQLGTRSYGATNDFHTIGSKERYRNPRRSCHLGVPGVPGVPVYQAARCSGHGCKRQKKKKRWDETGQTVGFSARLPHELNAALTYYLAWSSQVKYRPKVSKKRKRP